MDSIKTINEAQILAEFERDCQDRDFTPETIRRYKRVAKMFCDFLKSKSRQMTEIDKYVLRDFIHYRRENGTNPKTIGYDFAALSTFYGFLVFEGYSTTNPVMEVKKRYLKSYKTAREESRRKIISVEQMSMLVNSILSTRDRAVCILLAKTGLRRAELVSLDLQDINWRDQSILLKKGRFKKRTNREIFFDDECAYMLKKWLPTRSRMTEETDALFIGEQGMRLNRNGIYTLVTKYAADVGLHKPESNKMEDHFSTHNFRHWFTTHLLRNGMPREYVKELRGDGRRETVDIYHHIDRDDLRKKYLSCMPKIGI